jgi:hypothetical protein
MGAVQKALDAIEEFVEDTLEDAVESNFETVGSMLRQSMDMTQSNVGMDQFRPANMIVADPVAWQGGGPWQTVQLICENAIIPVASLIFMVVIITDLVQILIEGNQFENAEISTFFKWFIKVAVGLLVITNIFNIVTALFTIGIFVGERGLNVLNTEAVIADLTNIPVDGLGMGELILLTILTIILFLAVLLLLGAIIITLASRIIEIFMYISVAPIPAATFLNNEGKQMSLHWLRGVVALAFQGFFIVIALAIFSAMFNNVLATLNEMQIVANNVIIAVTILLAYTLALIFTVLRSGQISKSIFNAN